MALLATRAFSRSSSSTFSGICFCLKRRYVRQPMQSVWKSMAQASFHSNDFDFAKCASGKILDSEAASCRFAREVFCIDFVEGGKVFHVRKEASVFYHIINGEFYHAYSALIMRKFRHFYILTMHYFQQFISSQSHS